MGLSCLATPKEFRTVLRTAETLDPVIGSPMHSGFDLDVYPAAFGQALLRELA
jgi:hypothetical protein